MGRLSPIDPSSFARPDLAIVTDMNLVLTVNFENKIFRGTADLTVRKVDPKVNEVILDVKALYITEIYELNLNRLLKFTIGRRVGEFGSKMTVELPPKEDDIYHLSITYKTSPNASGLQWLEPGQTAGKVHPFVFSQFQAVHARSFVPCQDTPAVKTPYKALITAPEELTVVMSASRMDRREVTGQIMTYCEQKVPIPSYLIAIAIGPLVSVDLSPRTRVWAEEEIIEKAAYEFALTENQLKAAEEVCGPYLWGMCALLVLPPSFPYGGMENPCLIFVTPTLLAGDRSLAGVTAHEIAHSWTGNLITNCNFEHFWLNEGFTVFVERKIIGRLTSPQEQDLQAYLGVAELKETINHLGHDNPLTALVLNLEDIHPDDSFSKVPYEKGSIFLRYLEIMVGGPTKFEPFMRDYFETFKYKSIDTNDFQSFFQNYFADNPCIKKVDWDTWLYKPGMPPIVPEYDDTLMEVCITYKGRWINWDLIKDDPPFQIDDLKVLTVTQIIQLLQDILDEAPQDIKKLKAINRIFKFDNMHNAEIKYRWLLIGLKAHWEEKIEPALQWINSIGRMKFVRPLYRVLYNWEEARAQTIMNFHENKYSMMYVCAYVVGKDLHLCEEEADEEN